MNGLFKRQLFVVTQSLILWTPRNQESIHKCITTITLQQLRYTQFLLLHTHMPVFHYLKLESLIIFALIFMEKIQWAYTRIPLNPGIEIASGIVRIEWIITPWLGANIWRRFWNSRYWVVILASKMVDIRKVVAWSSRSSSKSCYVAEMSFRLDTPWCRRLM